MLTEHHKLIAGKIWEIANRLRGPYRPPQYRLVMLPMVVKKLAGVQAVQTLSRLNRTAPGKTRTFVLEFNNDEADI